MKKVQEVVRVVFPDMWRISRSVCYTNKSYGRNWMKRSYKFDRVNVPVEIACEDGERKIADALAAEGYKVALVSLASNHYGAKGFVEYGTLRIDLEREVVANSPS